LPLRFKKFRLTGVDGIERFYLSLLVPIDEYVAVVLHVLLRDDLIPKRVRVHIRIRSDAEKILDVRIRVRDVAVHASNVLRF
jgi:hypothetical protein